MKLKRTVTVALGLAALMTALCSMGCDSAGSSGESTSAKEDAVKYMGGPPPGAQKPAGGAPGDAKAPAPPGPGGAAGAPK